MIREEVFLIGSPFSDHFLILIFHSGDILNFQLILPLGHPVRQLCDLDDDHRHKRQADRDHQMAWIQRRH